MKIDLAKTPNLDSFRGMSKITKPFKVYNWQRLSSEDLNYFVRSILSPYRVSIELKVN